MPSFKPKNAKKIIVCEKTNTTLDGKHKELLEEFAKQYNETLPNLRLQRKTIKQNLLSEGIPVEEKLELEDRLKEIKEQMGVIKRGEKEYRLNNSKYVFEYFENKKKIAEGTSKTTMLDNFFKVNKDVVDTGSKDRTNLQKYLTNVDESFLDVGNFVVQTDICNFCGKGEMIPIDHEGLLVCNACSHSVKYLVENEKPSYKEPPKEVCFYAYKRINHFREILAQFQAKETTQIPDEVLENIKLQIKKSVSSLNKSRTKKRKRF